MKHSTRRSFVVICGSISAWLVDRLTAQADDLLSIRKARRRVQPLCAVPPADYQFGARTPSLIVRSMPAIPRYAREDIDALVAILKSYSNSIAEIESVTIPEPTAFQLADRAELALSKRLEADSASHLLSRPISKSMQLADAQLTIAHCSLSDVALVVEPSGLWQLSLRGDQNYLRRDEARPRNLDLQIKRNAFKVKFRLLRSTRSGGENLTPAVGGEPEFYQTGKTALAAIDVPEFWVQREAPQSITQSGRHPMIAAHYDEIDQAEFEFFVKLDPLTGNGQGVVQPWQR